jgi:hypothetical protein
MWAFPVNRLKNGCCKCWLLASRKRCGQEACQNWNNTKQQKLPLELGAVHQDVANPMPLSQENITMGIQHIPISNDGDDDFPPSPHPFDFRIFHEINHPSNGLP